MDLRQTKLTKNEWDALEVPLPKEERVILELIYNGYNDISHTFNYTLSLIAFVKISHELEKFHVYFYNTYFRKLFGRLAKKYNLSYPLLDFQNNMANMKLKTADTIRIKNSERKLDKVKKNIFEFILINFVARMFKKQEKKSYYYFTLSHIINNSIYLINPYVLLQIKHILRNEQENMEKEHFIKKSYEYIEKNPYLLQFANYQLYDHQKRLFWLCKNEKNAKLINYIAPTGTGKTLSPIGLCRGNKVIFTCAAKHVGMQLAKSCISLNIPIAIAFGCMDASDVRLHFFAVKECIRHRKSGRIFRVDNSVGDKVDIIICDIQSYLIAMNYMLAFNDEKDIIWYWDEPTITLDYETHEFHKIIRRNWHENIIPNVILSSATLPKQVETQPCINTFLEKFPGAAINEIVSYECKKTIPIYDTAGFVILPHYIFPTFVELKKSLIHLNDNKTILRHFDLKEITIFILYVNQNKLVSERYLIDSYFENITGIDVLGLKLYYLILLKACKKNYEAIYSYFQQKRTQKYKSLIKIATEDAYTLTDGPTIFLADNVEKLGKIFLKSAKIPEQKLESLLKIIYKNNILYDELAKLTKNEEDRKRGLGKTEKFHERDHKAGSAEAKAIQDFEKMISEIRSKIGIVQLDSEYVPNSYSHQKIWAPNLLKAVPFTSEIGDDVVEKIMLLDVANVWKILLMMGIGVFVKHDCVEYSEIMKKLAVDQKLYLILASTDYIYGTNYQFCHGYLSKDLGNITQEKMIQAFGRVGRGYTQNDYSLRLRSDDLITKLLLPSTNKPEIINMNRLFG